MDKGQTFSSLDSSPRNKFYRLKDRAIVGGVCAGVAEHYGMKDDTVRYLYVGSPFIAAPLIIFVYLFQWLVYPEGAGE
ncbi:PspC domain-containing protein [Corynebacterium sp. zg-331]|nr:PspC domain-containing protein [Corynebacterium sp. zg-331]